MTYLPLVADEPQRDGGRELGAGAAEAQLDVTGLDDAPAVRPGERRDVGRDRELDPGARTWFQRDAGVADQADHRPGRLGYRVVQVELDDVGAGRAPVLRTVRWAVSSPSTGKSTVDTPAPVHSKVV